MPLVVPATDHICDYTVDLKFIIKRLAYECYV
ncbi:MAG: hypothetical protein JWN76_1167 [Chitinophagaceae bacterium]|nr:hypothetical protein [Chitinophagaceae bacterium]